MILRDPDNHSYEAVDAAFEVLIYSPERNDQILCENVVDWLNQTTTVPTPLLLIWSVCLFFVVSLLGFWASNTVRGWAINDASHDYQATQP